MSFVSTPTGTLSARIGRLMIANRGEIVVRIASTAHRLGISTVGVYSEPDRNSMHVDTVDVAVALGGATPAESYLRADAVIDAALAQGCQAVHPGYGFLAENAEFAEQVAAAGLIWVGPSPADIRLLGDKIAAKKAAIEAGVPTAPLFEIEAADDLPDDVPFPALVKAAAGGGGRGMRVVRSSDELADAVAAGSREAEAAFGDGTVFVEPYIERARHVEVQIIGDAHGHVIHLGERECSIQRRNQKIVEESPSPGILPETRAALCEGAVKLAASTGYQNAGTVEFLVGEAGTVDEINFLEVNTRLQVEHPVTEAVTGVDLVELQLRVAAGEALPVVQDDVSSSGHAIEVRVVAEDPAAGWLPSTGEVTAFDIGEGVRVDTGFRAGAVVSPDYDSMLAKVIAHAPTRTEAAARLRRALLGSDVAGVTTNVPALTAILGEPDYLAARTPTAYLDEHPDVVAVLGPSGGDLDALLLAAVFAAEASSRSVGSANPLAFVPSGWRNVRTQGQRQAWTRAAEPEVEHHVEYTISADGAVVLLGPPPAITDDGSFADDDRRRVEVRLLRRAVGEIAIEVDGVRRTVSTAVVDGGYRTHSTAGSAVWTLAPRFVDHDAEAAGSGPVCPLPGSVLSVHVEVGQEVTDGDVLMVVEAMKMEHRITATGTATVSAVHFAAGDRVDQGDLLVSLESVDG